MTHRQLASFFVLGSLCGPGLGCGLPILHIGDLATESGPKPGTATGEDDGATSVRLDVPPDLSETSDASGDDVVRIRLDLRADETDSGSGDGENEIRVRLDLDAHGSDTGFGDSDDGGRIRLDIASIDTEETCVTDEPPVEVEAQTPSGLRTLRYAFWAPTACCGSRPWIILTAEPDPVIVNGAIVGDAITLVVDDAYGVADWDGPTAATIRSLGDSPSPSFATTVTFAAPVTLGETSSIEFSLAVEDGAWAVSGTFTAPYCAAIEEPACPCE